MTVSKLALKEMLFISLRYKQFRLCSVHVIYGLYSQQEDLLDLITALFKLALQSHRSADCKAVLDDSSITVDTTSLDQHKLFLLVIFVP